MIHIGKIRLKKSQKKEVKRVAEYLVSGGAFFWSGYISFFIIDQGLDWSLWWATSISYIIGWSVNFLLQRYWVFNNPKLAKHQTEVTGRYIAISLVNLVINYLILESLNTVGISPYIGQFISSAFFTVWNYFWYKLWVFPEKFPRKKHA
jgi:putative flippase GtrA